ncbi:polyphenol oxidase, chloroplastic-like [Magnolia sinica]|uniref:polyphenol oxidase, chloroplastic-like n=1 Tax=Magnolia sinica TaxID=86752 RepID=UPI002658E451|nr:polyphenol oxidase, chloroplastic-like [Magnolia sinica]
MAIHEVFKRLFPESTMQADFSNQLLWFRDVRGTFSSALAKASTETMMSCKYGNTIRFSKLCRGFVKRRKICYLEAKRKSGLLSQQFETAIQKMRELDTTEPNNPLGFTQQAKLHCTFCNGAYSHNNKEAASLQVHFSWFFLPWHRWYIYFFERILTKLLDDGYPVRLPYWNFDSLDGMGFPGIYAKTDSPLYDELRNKDHAREDNKLDLFYPDDTNWPANTKEEQELMNRNLCYFKKIFDETKDDPLQFIGCPIRSGEQFNFDYAGYLENLHNVVHVWTGTTDSENNYNFDLGNFIRSARDPIFYAHHSNMDRVWEIYRAQNKGSTNLNHLETNETDWLDSSFVFYDENKELVKVMPLPDFSSNLLASPYRFHSHTCNR